jgi:hypothetical protein
METQKTKNNTPRLIQSLTSGFNLAASNIKLILLPILIDLLLWFGPRLRVQTLFSPLVKDVASTMATLQSADLQGLTQTTQEIWQLVLEHFNLLSLLRTYPIGVPSLIAGQGTLQTPIGTAMIVEIPSFLIFFLGWLGVVLVGIVVGVFYFSEIARSGMTPRPVFSFSHMARQYFQMLLLTLVLLAAIMMICTPLILLLSVLSMINPALMELGLIFLGLLLLWLLMPLVFSAHGVFAFQDNILASMLKSAQLVRFLLPGTGLFFVAILLISQGLDIIWLFPPETSWMTLVGIAGHAFIATALVASSFAYYRQGIAYIQDLKAAQRKPVDKVI